MLALLSRSLLRPTSLAKSTKRLVKAQPRHVVRSDNQLHRLVSTDIEMPTFEIVEEKPIHARYLTVFDRKVRITSSKPGEAPTELHYDVVGHPRCSFKFAVAFPFHRAQDGGEPTVTVIREYCQGPNAVCYNLPTGGYDPRKHTSLEECVMAELSEEALLRGGQLVRLTPDSHPGFAEVKWCANRFTPFLVVDAEADPTPGTRDAEEYIQVQRVPVSELRRLLVAGDMMLPSIVTAQMALAHLEAAGEIPRP
uniref:Nudix hydrolase domain-containing protein n=1 Tax=Chlamydomonas leiostraca TaxID=1034604 RepID=A0A7S0WJV1_9CHLO